MGIRFQCENCQHKLNIKAHLAGKRGICPHCDARIRIPLESTWEPKRKASSGDEHALSTKRNGVPAETKSAPSAGSGTHESPPRTGPAPGSSEHSQPIESGISQARTQFEDAPETLASPTQESSATPSGSSDRAGLDERTPDAQSPVDPSRKTVVGLPDGTVRFDDFAEFAEAIADGDVEFDVDQRSPLSAPESVFADSSTSHESGRHEASPLNVESAEEHRSENLPPSGELTAGEMTGGDAGSAAANRWSDEDGGLDSSNQGPPPGSFDSSSDSSNQYEYLPTKSSGVGLLNAARKNTLGDQQAPPVPGAVDPIDEAPEKVWYVRPPSGGQYGPAAGHVMRRWLEEGRVSSQAIVWREGWDDWLPSTQVFPQLKPTDEVEAATPVDTPPEALPGKPIPEPKMVDESTSKILAYKKRRAKNAGCAVAAIVVLSVLTIGLAALLFVIVF